MAEGVREVSRSRTSKEGMWYLAANLIFGRKTVDLYQNIMTA
jgi:hypothetical protein